MNRPLPTLQKLIRHLQKVPYLASKNVFKVAGYLINSDLENVTQLCQVILEAKEKIRPCTRCFNWTEGDVGECDLCLSPERDGSVLCIVESWYDLSAIERAGGYRGLYHILGGVLSPLEGIGPEKLTIAHLLERIARDGIREVIFATNSTPEGDATALFIASKLASMQVNLSKFASGIPTGSLLEFMDKVTISKALSGRVPF